MDKKYLSVELHLVQAKAVHSSHFENNAEHFLHFFVTESYTSPVAQDLHSPSTNYLSKEGLQE